MIEKISEHDRRQIVTEMQATWQAIGLDVLESLGEDLISRDSVFELVGQRMYSQASVEYVFFLGLSDDLQHEIKMEAFPEENFGR